MSSTIAGMPESELPTGPEQVTFLAHQLGIERGEVLSAAGLSQRAWARWEQGGRPPRARARRRLAELTHVVGDLAVLHADLPGWFAHRTDAQRAFAQGNASELLLADLMHGSLARHLEV